MVEQGKKNLTTKPGLEPGTFASLEYCKPESNALPLRHLAAWSKLGTRPDVDSFFICGYKST
jgi:hypothetical protein